MTAAPLRVNNAFLPVASVGIKGGMPVGESIMELAKAGGLPMGAAC